MIPRRILVSLAVAALAACAAALPSAGIPSSAAVGPSATSNEISKEVVETKPGDAKDQVKLGETTTSASKTSSTTERKNENREENSNLQDATNDTAKTVNQLFPHAVLFGGTCGGSIISSKWILTAGHCTLFTSGHYILAGTDNSENSSGVRRRVKRLVIHPLFSVGPYWLDADQFGIKQVAARWDFLLAELDTPLPLDNATMIAVDLDDAATIPEGLEVGYAGYGAERHGETMRHNMHGMELQVLADSKCQEALVQYEAKDMVCTQGRPPRYDSACNGDSGSGLVADGKLYGVASWVQEDSHRCFNGALVVFSRVSAVRDWIRQVTKI